MEITTTIFLVLFFLLAEGFFSGSELALVSLSKIRLRRLAESGSKFATEISGLLKTPENVFGTTSVGTNLSVFAGSAVATAYFANLYGAKADLYAFLVMGPLTLILGEIVPKAVFRPNAEALGPYITRPLKFFQWVFTPVLTITTFISQLIIKYILRQKEVRITYTSRDEIRLLTKLSESKLNLDTEEKKMIDRIFAFGTNNVETAMQPLVNVVAVSDASTIGEVKTRIAETGYSRLPVYNERIFNIIGVVSAFDILRHQDQSQVVSDIMSPAYYVPSAKKNAHLLTEMQESGVHFGVVVDEYGAGIGVVTVEDLLEEIVGDIEDEYDTTVKSHEKLDESRYIIDASMEVDSINDELGFDLPVGDYETLGGFLNEALERIPKKRERVAIGSYLFTVLDATPRKIMSVELEDLRIKQESDGEEDVD